MSKFYPALAHTDSIGYFDASDNRKVMSVRSLLPPSMSPNFLISLSFDEKIHYETPENIGDRFSTIKLSTPKINTVFVDCGAFHYVNEESPKFKKGGFVTSKTAFDEYLLRHVNKNSKVKYLLCSPDHIVGPDCDDDTFTKRRHFITSSAKGFFKRVQDIDNVTPVAVVHGRTKEERYSLAKELIEIGYEYIAFGGLVPLARNPAEVLHQIAGVTDLENPIIDARSALGICLLSGCKTHMFGLNSPEWYRWWKRMDVTSFDGSKLSQEGAANGIIWKVNQSVTRPKSAKDLYNRLQIKKISSREWNKNSHLSTLITSPDGNLDLTHAGWEYLQTARCTSPNCPAKDIVHNCDPRVTGSIEHNMGRMIVNAYAFEEIMRQIDTLHERANLEDCTGDKKWLGNWKTIEVGK
ncbi:MAG: hypothetical protein VYB50_01370 [Candidatus Thermoplasmatota archaeon]|nr:hypothetical protein [Candidatus Thermoplasmatota archaeon]